MNSISKAALTRRLAFSVFSILLLISCSDPASVGGEFVEQSEVRVDTIYINDLPTDNVDPYLGRLAYSALGEFSDPLYGDISSFLMVKPSIVKSESTPDLVASDSFTLRLNIHETARYGDTTATGMYSIYRINDMWRGTTYKKSNSVTWGSELIGQFEINSTTVDTAGFVEIPLSGSWVNDYIAYFNVDDDSTRSESYRRNEFGLAIVPDAGTNKLVYTSFSSSRLRITTSADTSDKVMLDWAYDYDKGADNQSSEHLNLFNTFERFITLNLEDIVAQLPNQNFLRAEMVFYEDTTLMKHTSLGANEIRPRPSLFVLAPGPKDDKAYSLAFEGTGLSGPWSNGKYTFNLTALFNANLFGSTALNEVYIYPFASEGLMAYSSIYGVNVADKALAPKVIVYGLVKETN